MIKIENTCVHGFEPAVRGMRNPLESWEKGDSKHCIDADSSCDDCGYGKPNVMPCPYGNPIVIGKNDLTLMKKLAAAGSDHRKYMRMITVYCDITAMQPWWSEFDTYKIATVRNSCSKMHRIHVEPFLLPDFSCEGCIEVPYAYKALVDMINVCERLRNDFNATHDKKYWRALIELLPEGYNMRATVMLNYEVLRNMYNARKNHKLTEWHTFCDWIKTLPYSELITGEA